MKTKQGKKKSNLPERFSQRRKSQGNNDSGCTSKKMKTVVKQPPNSDVHSNTVCGDNIGVVEARHPHDQNNNEINEDEGNKHLKLDKFGKCNAVTLVVLESHCSSKEKVVRENIVQSDNFQGGTYRREDLNDTDIENKVKEGKKEHFEEALLPVIEIIVTSDIADREASIMSAIGNEKTIATADIGKGETGFKSDIRDTQTGATQDTTYIALSEDVTSANTRDNN